jgi:hypothetical protein
MGVEHEKGEKQPTSDEMKQELLAYLKDADFGTPKFLALGDLLYLQRYEESLLQSLNFVTAPRIEQPRESSDISRLRILEMKIALLEHKIDNCQLTIPGYGKAYSHIDIAVEDFSGTLLGEEDKDPVKGRFNTGMREMWDDLWEECYKREG